MSVPALVGASLSEPHTSESAGAFPLYVCIYIVRTSPRLVAHERTPIAYGCELLTGAR